MYCGESQDGFWPDQTNTTNCDDEESIKQGVSNEIPHPLLKS